MCILSADLARLFCAAAALILIAFDAEISAVSAQGYPSAFNFGEPASDGDVAAMVSAIALDGKGLPPRQRRRREMQTSLRNRLRSLSRRRFEGCGGPS
jgi:hypothetical protein